ncbi:MAG: TonB-dependent receptor [Ignavibacteriae bacterium]|nr:MAG: TonB-dependent receptor [Ignavibacteriota bacterium]
MKFLKIFYVLLFQIISLNVFAQTTGTISGKVADIISSQPLPGVNILVVGTNFGTSTNINGEFKIKNIPVGNYQVRASFIGYTTQIKSDVIVNSTKPSFINFKLEESVIELEGVTVTADLFENVPTEVNSIKSFSYEEIRRAPGGFEDVVRALSILPGVARQSAGRNDLVVRGGAPSENLYLVDGFTVPNINHFGSQGSTGGPLSFINLDFVNETTFSTGGFQANYGDKLSSVLKIDLREGRKDRIGGKVLVSASQFGFNLEGPVNDKSNFLFSIRRSYLDFIFNAAGFNFVPEYYDLLTKYNYNIDNKNKISYLFIGALDRVKFNNDDKDDIYDNSRILGTDQNQYTTGISFKHLFSKGFYNLTLNRNYVKYDGFQKDTLLNPIFLNQSKEAEHEFKADLVYKIAKSSEVNIGTSFKIINFKSKILFPKQYRTTFGEILPITSINTNTNFYKACLYALYSANYFGALRFNFGLRTNYFNAVENKFTVSPRLSLGYDINNLININFSTGIYRQAPSYIWLAIPENKKLESIQVNQYILGLSYMFRKDTKLKVETFFKDYSKYPTSLIRPYLVLANTGAGYSGTKDNFGAFGLEPLTSKGKGYSRGVEFSVQKKSTKNNLYGVASLTYCQTYFAGLDNVEREGQYNQSWIINLSGGFIFNSKWETSFKFRFATGSPYTPFNPDGTQNITDYLSLNLKSSHGLDIRVDRRWDFSNLTLITYIDLQNIYNQKNITGVRYNYRTKKIEENEEIGILPSIGISLEF